ncbi:MAG: glycosyltransferase family 39 protein [Lachnospiraceae bacterium]|nr:glycosyltransferase family 39 protein [Lachnospiraceae bacterium]
MKTDIFENSKKARFIAAALIFVLAFALRVIGANWGMPRNDLHPDEGFVFNEAYECALNRTFESRIYYRPNHVSIRLNTILYVGIQEVVFSPKGLGDFAANFNEHFSLFITASRVLAALMGAGAVVFAYLIACFWDKKKALYAALLFAVFSSFIEHSHYLTPDMPLLLFLMGALWAALSYHNKPSISMLFWMSFFTALATCEKYPGLYGCVLIAVAVIITQYKKPLMIVRDGLLAIFFVILGITAISPVLLLDFREVYHTMQGQNKTAHLGADGLNFFETFVYYSKTSAVGLGLVLTVCSLYGMVKSFIKNFKPTVILFAFLVYIIPISAIKVHWERYTLPIYATMLLFAAFGAFYLYDDLFKRFKESKRVGAVLCIVLFALPIVSQFLGGVANTARFLAPDTRVALQQTFADMGVTADNTPHDCNTPLDPGGFYGAFSNFENCNPALFKYGSLPRYVMTSSAQRDEVLNADPETYGGIARFYELLDSDYTLVARYTAEVPMPHFIDVYNIGCSLRSIIRYCRGAMTGYEIRLYRLFD